MKKHLATILGIVLTLVIAAGVFVLDFKSRDNSSYHRARTLETRCYEEKVAAGGVSSTQVFPECHRFDDAHNSGFAGRLTSAAMFGAAVGAGFALLFFGGRRLLRRRSAKTAAGA
jgi:hypothetical protein